jgi:hypothetical protein
MLSSSDQQRVLHNVVRVEIIRSLQLPLALTASIAAPVLGALFILAGASWIITIPFAAVFLFSVYYARVLRSLRRDLENAIGGCGE